MPLPEFFVHFYDHLPIILKLPVWFFINIILVRGILANEIMQEIKQRSLIKGGIIHYMVHTVSRWHTVARKSAIMQHYRLHARGDGHTSKSVLDCGQGKCAIF